MDSTFRPRERVGTIAAWALGVTFVILAALKAPLILKAHSSHVDGLGGLLRSPEALIAATLIEVTLGVLVVTRARALAILAIQTWLAMLCGTVIALVVLGAPVSSCGCFGARDAGLAVRISVLCGLGITAYVASASVEQCGGKNGGTQRA